MGVPVKKNATCKRCGSTSVAWVKSKRTGNFYLAFATFYSGGGYVDPNGHSSGGGQSWTAHPQSPHDCKSPNRGGYNVCVHCGRHHPVPWSGVSTWTAEDWAASCAHYPDAPEGVVPEEPAVKAMREHYAANPGSAELARKVLAKDHLLHPDNV